MSSCRTVDDTAVYPPLDDRDKRFGLMGRKYPSSMLVARLDLTSFFTVLFHISQKYISFQAFCGCFFDLHEFVYVLNVLGHNNWSFCVNNKH